MRRTWLSEARLPVLAAFCAGPEVTSGGVPEVTDDVAWKDGGAHASHVEGAGPGVRRAGPEVKDGGAHEPHV